MRRFHFRNMKREMGKSRRFYFIQVKREICGKGDVFISGRLREKWGKVRRIFFRKVKG